MIDQSEEGKLAEAFLDKAFKNYPPHLVNYPQHLVIELANIIHTAKLKVKIEARFKPSQKDEKTEFMIGQRVILGQGAMKEIGSVVNSETGMTRGVWVYSPVKGYASDYAIHNVRPLPNGEL